MSAGSYLLGVVVLGAALVALGMGAVGLRSRLVPGFEGAPARLAEVTLGHSLLLALALALGTVGQLDRVPLLVGCLLAGAAGWRARLPRGARTRKRKAERAPRTATWIAVGVCCVVAAAWIRRALTSLDLGMGGVDTLWYHMPLAARFLQDERTTNIHFHDVEFLTAFYPANVELFHAVSISLFGSDALAPLLNLGWLGLALLAAWCLGRPFGAAPGSLAAVALALGLPTLVVSQAGEAKNDIAALALLLAAAAIVAELARRGRGEGLARGAVLVAGLAAGFALGARVTLAVPVAALIVAVAWLASRGTRRDTALTLTAGVAVTGAYWYLRNLIAVGNPLPGANVSAGPLELPRPAEPPLERTGRAVVDYATDTGVWVDWFGPGLKLTLGPLWWLVIGLTLAGTAVALLRPAHRAARALAAIAAITLVAYLFTPQTAAGLDGEPVGFALNVRYLAPGLALGLALLAIQPALRAPRRAAWAAAGAGALTIVALTAENAWAGEHAKDAIAAGILLALAAAAALGGRVARGARVVAVGLAVAFAALAAGYSLQRDYERGAYTEALLPYTSWADFALQPAFLFAREQSGARIGLGGTTVGFFQYPFYGRDLDNHVQYVAERGAHGSFTPLETCAEWRRALAEGDYDYAVTAPYIDPWRPFEPRPSPETEWTRSDPGARQVLESAGRVFVFRLERPPSPGACPPEGS